MLVTFTRDETRPRCFRTWNLRIRESTSRKRIKAIAKRSTVGDKMEFVIEMLEEIE